MSAEEIAKVVRDVQNGRVLASVTRPGEDIPHFRDTPTIDITAVYREFVNAGKPHLLYEDSVGRPPWTHANFAYVNEHGNVHLMRFVTSDRYADFGGSTDVFNDMRWETDNDVRWDDVRWITMVSFYIGGRRENGTVPVPTAGPFLFVFMAVYPDGQIADIHWKGNSEQHDDFLMPLDILLQAVTILNCRNVEILEPVSRSKHERKRIARTGITVSEIHVTKIGAYRRHNGPQRFGEGVPLGTVRGHVARYGEKYGRGKLFGKYEGEFWVPAFLRGRRELGEVHRDYDVG